MNNTDNLGEELDLFVSISQATVSIRNKNDLVSFIQLKLKNIFPFSDLAITRFNTSKGTFKVFLEHCDKTNQHPDFSSVAYEEYPIKDGLHDKIMESETSVVLSVDSLIESGMKHLVFLQNAGIKEIVGIRLLQNGEVFGGMVLLSEEEGSFTVLQRRLIEKISNYISSAVANIIANEEIQNRDREKSILLSLSNETAKVKNKEELFSVIRVKLKELFSIVSFGIIVKNTDSQTHSFFMFEVDDETKDNPDFQHVINHEYITTNDEIFNTILNSDSPVILDINQLEGTMPLYAEFWKKRNIRSIIGVALRVANDGLGCLFLRIEDDFDMKPMMDLLKGVSSQIAIALSNIISNEKNQSQLKEIVRYKEQLENEKAYLQEEITSGNRYGDIIGGSEEMRNVFHMLSQVAFTNSTVLILGETGTGKELIARAIHNSSPRKNNLLVKVNCAALPTNLIESELFGHEKGSFTGAFERRIGKFELAHKGTLFLDEIGEMPVELQVKLLRAIQEKEIERVGGKGILKTDVRIIAATNRNLIKEVDEGKFRSDLYYRLNVFPIHMPSLKNRKEDIPELVSYFVAKFSKTVGKTVKDVSKKAMSELLQYDWPGNVRELEHVIERSILMTEGDLIKDVFFSYRDTFHENKKETGDRTIAGFEKQHIIAILKQCNGKVFGPTGAAVILGVPHTTLHSKIKKLGITKTDIFG
ncbi:transcriptional regulator with GAF, ATPase, and Fis domain [Chryseobacterium ginsenosidimutans]|uniref:sigma-54-dependent Fis family transcriptional regulator n=1 Tax=Chryseobacterium ginsenosidimutans TaxID=687846 RepID=UPI002169C2D2|nr:sigma 54-interacting transcriptional regulator [Chryseobacterium ginsenosidimutans]MCS3870263.1 transcriptional regulator with GAF, ATPase, and Fis domain [Chryseobacterium ginsenosidimutans]